MWFAIARRYRTRYINEYRGINFPVAASEPRLSSLTVATARGRLLFHQAVIEDYLDFVTIAPLLILKSLINYSRYSFIVGSGLPAQLSRIGPWRGRCSSCQRSPSDSPSSSGIACCLSSLADQRADEPQPVSPLAG